MSRQDEIAGAKARMQPDPERPHDEPRDINSRKAVLSLENFERFTPYLHRGFPAYLLLQILRLLPLDAKLVGVQDDFSDGAFKVAFQSREFRVSGPGEMYPKIRLTLHENGEYAPYHIENVEWETDESNEERP